MRFKPTICSVEGCLNEAKSRGFCNAHYGRWKRHGDPLISRRQRTHPPLCTVPDCDRPWYSLGLCSIHYERLSKHGTIAEPSRRPRYAGTVTAKGYVRFQFGRKGKLEHRAVMEALIGRHLEPGEVVHHINHDRSDNRPENLELHSSQADHIRKAHSH